MVTPESAHRGMDILEETENKIHHPGILRGISKFVKTNKAITCLILATNLGISATIVGVEKDRILDWSQRHISRLILQNQKGNHRRGPMVPFEIPGENGEPQLACAAEIMENLAAKMREDANPESSSAPTNDWLYNNCSSVLNKISPIVPESVAKYKDDLLEKAGFKKKTLLIMIDKPNSIKSHATVIIPDKQDQQKFRDYRKRSTHFQHQK